METKNTDKKPQDTEKELAHYAEKRRLSEQVDNSETVIISLSRNRKTTKFEVANELLDKLASKLVGEE